MAAPEITVTFNPPIASDSGSVFDAKAFDTIGKLNPWGLEANAVAAYCGEQSNSALASAVAAAAGSLDLADRAVFAGQVVGVENGPGYPLAGFDIEEIQPATQAQAEAGTATGVYMDPLRTKDAIAHQVVGVLPFDYGAVGTYVWGFVSNIAITPGNTYAGSMIYPAGIIDSDATSAGSVNNSAFMFTYRGSAALSGTWRAMGQTPSQNSVWTLFLRIA